MVVTILFCSSVSCIGGLQNSVLRWVKSLEFPAIEARYKPLSDQLVIVTADTLINESHSIGNARFMTNDDYTGVVGGEFTMLFGTNRSFESVRADYMHFFASKPDWKLNSYDYPNAHKIDDTAEINIRTLSKTESPSSPWAKYQTIYEVTLSYGDRVLWEA